MVVATDKLAVFRTDASAEIGAGHVVRCMALAEHLREAGVSCGFAVSEETAAAVPLLAGSDFSLSILPCDARRQPAALAEHWPGGAELLIVDHYGLDVAFAHACRPWARRVLVIDDLAKHPQACNILVDPTSGRTAAEYKRRVPSGCRLLLGPRYALLRRQFAAMRETALARRAKTARVRRLLVSLGGTDPTNATSLALRAIAESRLDFEVAIVLNGTAPHLSSVRSLASTLPQPVTVHTDISDMAALMTDADLAIGAAGSSSWERCCLGLASVVIPVAHNQQANAAAVAAAGAALVLPNQESVIPASVTRALTFLTQDGDARAAMSRAAAGLSDGLGARRVVLESVSLAVSRSGNRVSLRPATTADGELIFDWQCHPATRRFARNAVAPSWPEHERWISERLGSTDCLFDVILHDGRPAGVLRLDRRADASFEVSIFVDPDAHGRGIGLATLRAARWLMPEATLRAEVLAGNEASHALFQAAGYVWTGDCYIAKPEPGGPEL